VNTLKPNIIYWKKKYAKHLGPNKMQIFKTKILKKATIIKHQIKNSAEKGTQFLIKEI
jgi:hypothetical protein